MRSGASALSGAIVLALLALGGCKSKQEVPPVRVVEQPEPPVPEAPDAGADAVAVAGTAADAAGGCSLEAVQPAVRGRSRQVRSCYEEALQRDARLAGRVVVRLGIDTSGQVKDRGLYESDMPAEVNACVVAALEGLEVNGRFEKPCVILYPFRFSAGPPGTP